MLPNASTLVSIHLLDKLGPYNQEELLGAVNGMHIEWDQVVRADPDMENLEHVFLITWPDWWYDRMAFQADEDFSFFISDIKKLPNVDIDTNLKTIHARPE